MGALLIHDWLADALSQAVVDEASVSQLREEVRRVAAGRLDATTTEQLVTAASELGMNQLVHAGGGRVAVLPIERAGVVGVEVIAADAGPGIATPSAALRGEVGPHTKGLGAGLSAVLRLCQEVDFDVRQGEGTCVWARSYASALPRSEVAILGRPHPHERVSGDHAAFARRLRIDADRARVVGRHVHAPPGGGRAPHLRLPRLRLPLHRAGDQPALPAARFGHAAEAIPQPHPAGAPMGRRAAGTRPGLSRDTLCPHPRRAGRRARSDRRD